LADLKKSSPLKPLGQMNRNLVGSTYGRSSLKIAYFEQEFPVASMFVNGSKLNEHLYIEPSKDDSYQISIHLAKRLEEKIF
jgi:hypothetical protein